MGLHASGCSVMEIVEELGVGQSAVRGWLRVWRDDPDVSEYITRSNLLIAERAEGFLHDVLDVLGDFDLEDAGERKEFLKYAIQINQIRGTAQDKILSQRRNDNNDEQTGALKGLLAAMARQVYDPENPPLLPEADGYVQTDDRSVEIREVKEERDDSRDTAITGVAGDAGGAAATDDRPVSSVREAQPA